MTTRVNRWLLMAIILVAVPFWWLLVASDGSGGPAKPLHIADLRKLAAIIPGARPGAVTETLIATRLATGDVVAGGIGLKRQSLAIVTWSLPVPDKGPVVIDPGLPPIEAHLGTFIHVDRGKLSQIGLETSLASLVLYTQGHLSQPTVTTTKPTPDPLAQAVAPGVVVIPTTSYAPDTRLIFVTLGDGREFLFCGDIATLSQNWSQLRIRSHLAAMSGAPQNPQETYAWLRTIRQLHDEAPQMRIVPGHDLQWVVKQLVNGTITEMRPTVMPIRQHRR